MKCQLIAATLTTLILAAHLTAVRCRPNRIRACGKELADILQNTCLRGYNTYYQGGADENLSNGTRKKRGITQECCMQSCSLKDLLQYCSGGAPINATEPPPVDLSPGRVKNPRHQIKLLPNNQIDVDSSEDPNGGAGDAPSTPPPPRLDHSLDTAYRAPPFQEPHANVTPTSSGVHSTPPWFRGKTPAIVLYIGKKFNFGYQSPPKNAS